MTQEASFEAVTNREDWVQQIAVYDDAGALVDLTGASIIVAVYERRTNANVLLASTDAGNVVIDGPGVFKFTFPVTQMRGLDASRAYDLGCTVAINGETKQLLRASVPVLDGFVP